MTQEFQPTKITSFKRRRAFEMQKETAQSFSVNNAEKKTPLMQDLFKKLNICYEICNSQEIRKIIDNNISAGTNDYEKYSILVNHEFSVKRVINKIIKDKYSKDEITTDQIYELIHDIQLLKQANVQKNILRFVQRGSVRKFNAVEIDGTYEQLKKLASSTKKVQAQSLQQHIKDNQTFFKEFKSSLLQESIIRMSLHKNEFRDRKSIFKVFVTDSAQLLFSQLIFKDHDEYQKLLLENAIDELVHGEVNKNTIINKIGDSNVQVNTRIQKLLDFIETQKNSCGSNDSIKKYWLNDIGRSLKGFSNGLTEDSFAKFKKDIELDHRQWQANRQDAEKQSLSKKIFDCEQYKKLNSLEAVMNDGKAIKNKETQIEVQIKELDSKITTLKSTIQELSNLTKSNINQLLTNKTLHSLGSKLLDKINKNPNELLRDLKAAIKGIINQEFNDIDKANIQSNDDEIIGEILESLYLVFENKNLENELTQILSTGLQSEAPLTVDSVSKSFNKLVGRLKEAQEILEKNKTVLQTMQSNIDTKKEKQLDAFDKVITTISLFKSQAKNNHTTEPDEYYHKILKDIVNGNSDAFEGFANEVIQQMSRLDYVNYEDKFADLLKDKITVSMKEKDVSWIKWIINFFLNKNPAVVIDLEELFKQQNLQERFSEINTTYEAFVKSSEDSSRLIDDINEELKTISSNTEDSKKITSTATEINKKLNVLFGWDKTVKGQIDKMKQIIGERFSPISIKNQTFYFNQSKLFGDSKSLEHKNSAILELIISQLNGNSNQLKADLESLNSLLSGEKVSEKDISELAGKFKDVIIDLSDDSKLVTEYFNSLGGKSVEGYFQEVQANFNTLAQKLSSLLTYYEDKQKEHKKKLEEVKGNYSTKIKALQTEKEELQRICIKINTKLTKINEWKLNSHIERFKTLSDGKKKLKQKLDECLEKLSERITTINSLLEIEPLALKQLSETCNGVQVGSTIENAGVIAGVGLEGIGEKFINALQNMMGMNTPGARQDKIVNNLRMEIDKYQRSLSSEDTPLDITSLDIKTVEEKFLEVDSLHTKYTKCIELQGNIKNLKKISVLDVKAAIDSLKEESTKYGDLLDELGASEQLNSAENLIEDCEKYNKKLTTLQSKDVFYIPDDDYEKLSNQISQTEDEHTKLLEKVSSIIQSLATHQEKCKEKNNKYITDKINEFSLFCTKLPDLVVLEDNLKQIAEDEDLLKQVKTSSEGLKGNLEQFTENISSLKQVKTDSEANSKNNIFKDLLPEQQIARIVFYKLISAKFVEKNQERLPRVDNVIYSLRSLEGVNNVSVTKQLQEIIDKYHEYANRFNSLLDKNTQIEKYGKECKALLDKTKDQTHKGHLEKSQEFLKRLDLIIEKLQAHLSQVNNIFCKETKVADLQPLVQAALEPKLNQIADYIDKIIKANKEDCQLAKAVFDDNTLIKLGKNRVQHTATNGLLIAASNNTVNLQSWENSFIPNSTMLKKSESEVNFIDNAENPITSNYNASVASATEPFIPKNDIRSSSYKKLINKKYKIENKNEQINSYIKHLSRCDTSEPPPQLEKDTAASFIPQVRYTLHSMSLFVEHGFSSYGFIPRQQMLTKLRNNPSQILNILSTCRHLCLIGATSDEAKTLEQYKAGDNPSREKYLEALQVYKEISSNILKRDTDATGNLSKFAQKCNEEQTSFTHEYKELLNNMNRLIDKFSEKKAISVYQHELSKFTGEWPIQDNQQAATRITAYSLSLIKEFGLYAEGGKINDYLARFKYDFYFLANLLAKQLGSSDIPSENIDIGQAYEFIKKILREQKNSSVYSEVLENINFLNSAYNSARGSDANLIDKNSYFGSTIIKAADDIPDNHNYLTSENRMFNIFQLIASNSKNPSTVINNIINEDKEFAEELSRLYSTDQKDVHKKIIKRVFSKFTPTAEIDAILNNDHSYSRFASEVKWISDLVTWGISKGVISQEQFLTWFAATLPPINKCFFKNEIDLSKHNEGRTPHFNYARLNLFYLYIVLNIKTMKPVASSEPSLIELIKNFVAIREGHWYADTFKSLSAIEQGAKASFKQKSTSQEHHGILAEINSVTVLHDFWTSSIYIEKSKNNNADFYLNQQRHK